MGQFSNSLQELQLQKGRQDSRRGRNAANTLEKYIIDYLLRLGEDEEVVIWDSEDAIRYGLDPLVLDVIFKDYYRISAGRFGFHVGYEESD